MDTLLIAKDTIAVNILNVVDFSKQCSQEIPTNCQDVKVAAIVCGAVVLTTLIIAVSWLIYFWMKNNKLRKQQKAERIKEKEKEWFSLRKEYQGDLLDYLKVQDGSKEINSKYLEKLQKYIDWIDEQKK